jgi:hypothetical protein
LSDCDAMPESICIAIFFANLYIATSVAMTEAIAFRV